MSACLRHRKVKGSPVMYIHAGDYPPRLIRMWLKANSVSHEVPFDCPVLISGGWVRAYCYPLRSRQFPDGLTQNTGPGAWADIRKLGGAVGRRSKWRWFLLRTHPADHWPAYLEEKRNIDRQAAQRALAAVMGDNQ